MVLQTRSMFTWSGFQGLLNLGEKKGHRTSEDCTGWRGSNGSPPPWMQFFYHIFVSEMNQFYGCKAGVEVTVAEIEG